MAEKMHTTFRSDFESWINKKDYRGQTCLYIAAKDGHEPLVKLLLDNHADANTSCGQHGSAHLPAATTQNLDVTRLLVDSGAAIDPKVDRDQAILRAATKTQDREIVNLLLKTDIEGVLLRTAIQHRKKEVVKLLLVEGADATVKDDMGEMSLHHASSSDWCDGIELLLDMDPSLNINIQDATGQTPFYKACASKYLEVARLLLNKGADLNLPNSEGRTALHTASHLDWHGGVRLLLDTKSANIEFQHSDGQTALHRACATFCPEVVQLLLDQGADLGMYLTVKSGPHYK